MATMTASFAVSTPRAFNAVSGAKSDNSGKSSPLVSFPVSFPEFASRLSLKTQNPLASPLSKQSPFVVRASELITAESNPTAGPPSTRLFVGNLPFSVDSKSLADIFQEVGVVDLVEVIYDRESGRSRGFGFVTMNSIEDAENAISKLDGAEIGGRNIKVNFPVAKGTFERAPRRDFDNRRPSSSRDNPNKLYIGNLSWGMDDDSLNELFSEFGRVTDAKVVTDRDTGRSRGFGFVTLSNESEVNEAISALDGVEVDGRTIRVSLANAKRA